MLNLFLKKRKGFTLIELLVVIAIIGVLASIVLVSLSSARKKGRDAKRIADLKQVQLALELYANDNNSAYPASIAALSSGATKYLPNEPKDPSTAASYLYCANSGTYHIAATLEEGTSDALDADADTTDTACSVGGTAITGTDPVYDLVP